MTASFKESQKAIVNPRGILTKANESVDLFCKAPAGDSGLSLCLWEITGFSLQVKVVVYKGRIQNEGQASVEGISLTGDGMEAGKCGVRIHALKQKHFGDWNCTLVTLAGSIFKGQASIIDGNYSQ